MAVTTTLHVSKLPPGDSKTALGMDLQAGEECWIDLHRDHSRGIDESLGAGFRILGTTAIRRLSLADWRAA